MEASRKRQLALLAVGLLVAAGIWWRTRETRDFTVTFEEKFTPGDGGPARLVTRRTLARRSDGVKTMADQTITPAGTVEMSTRRLRIEGGVEIWITEETKSITGMTPQDPVGEERDQRNNSPDPSQKCMVARDGKTPRGGELLREEKMLGYDVVVISEASPGAKRTVWAAPALDCTELRRIADFGGAAGRSELIAIKVEEGRPNDSWFEIPADYKAVRPSDHYRQECEWRKVPADPNAIRQLLSADVQYAKWGWKGGH